MYEKCLHFFPISLIVNTIATFIMSYTVSVADKDIEPFFPYISDTGTSPPASCLFTFFINISAILLFCNVYIRYRQILILLTDTERRRHHLNLIAFIAGTLSSIGLSIVASFQVTTLEHIHNIGAVMTVCCGVVYMYLQSIVTYLVQQTPKNSARQIFIIRLVLSIISTIFVTMLFICYLVAEEQTDVQDKQRWKEKDGGYTAHVLSTTSQWIACLIFLLFTGTYILQFKQTTAELTFHMKIQESQNTVSPNENV